MDLFPSSGEEQETPSLWNPLGMPNLKHSFRNVVSSSYLEFWTEDIVYKLRVGPLDCTRLISDSIPHFERFSHFAFYLTIVGKKIVE
jgi:hypothetical protein